MEIRRRPTRAILTQMFNLFIIPQLPPDAPLHKRPMRQLIPHLPAFNSQVAIWDEREPGPLTGEQAASAYSLSDIASCVFGCKQYTFFLAIH